MNHHKKLLALFGLKYNPFLPNIPLESLWQPPGTDVFFFRIENLVMDGGFGLISGEVGLGKSKSLQLLANRLSGIEDVLVGIMERPQSGLGDFYRELGDLFKVNLSVANRYGGFKGLRQRWSDHIKRTLFRPVLLIDEAQEMQNCCMSELRLLSSAKFDSQNLLTIILCGDNRLPARFRSDALVSLGSRIRVRMILEPYEKPVLMDYLNYQLDQAGSPHLMSQPLKQTLIDHSQGNLRVLNMMASELLERGAQSEMSQLDEKLFIEVFSRHPTTRKKPSNTNR